MAPRSLFFGPLLYFRSVPALERLPSSLLGTIAQNAEEMFFPAGSPLLPPERSREAFFVIVEGKVSVREPGGREEVLGPGQALGFLRLLARSQESVDARAIWDTVALRVDWDAHLDVCERFFPILETHMGFLARRCLEERRRIREAIPSPGFATPRTDLLREPLGGEASLRKTAPTPLNLVHRLAALHRCKAFPSASMDALAELARHLEEVRLGTGEAHWSPGDPAGFFLLVVSGTLIEEGPGGAWREDRGAGAVAGRLEALAGLPREAFLRAREPTLSLRVALEPLLDILEDHFTMAVEFTAELARELTHLQGTGPFPPPPLEIL